MGKLNINPVRQIDHQEVRLADRPDHQTDQGDHPEGHRTDQGEDHLEGHRTDQVEDHPEGHRTVQEDLGCMHQVGPVRTDREGHLEGYQIDQEVDPD